MLKRIASFLFIFALIFSSTAFAAEDNTEEENSGKELSQKLIESEEPESLWKSFSEEEKKQVKDFGEIAEPFVKEVNSLEKEETVKEEKAEDSVVVVKEVTADEVKIKELYDQLTEDEKLAVHVYYTPVEVEKTDEGEPEEPMGYDADEPKFINYNINNTPKKRKVTTYIGKNYKKDPMFQLDQIVTWTFPADTSYTHEAFVYSPIWRFDGVKSHGGGYWKYDYHYRVIDGYNVGSTSLFKMLGGVSVADVVAKTWVLPSSASGLAYAKYTNYFHLLAYPHGITIKKNSP